MKLLIVEDEPAIAEVIAAYAKRDGYETRVAHDGEAALKVWDSEGADLIILDLMLPKISGEEVCRRVREKSLSVPIIMLTAKTSESDVIVGLDEGANDYVGKPFSPRVLMARVRAQLRPSSESGLKIKPGQEIITCAGGRIKIDMNRVEICKDGVPVPMTRSEFLIFATLAARPIKTWSRDEIISSALGDDYDGFDRTIDTYIKKIRKKLADAEHPSGWIKTIYGFGYRLDEGA